MHHPPTIRGLLAPTLIALLLALAGCVPVTEEPTPSLVDSTGFALYAHPTGVFTVQLPPDWVVNDTSDDFTINVEFSPPGSPVPLLGITIVEQTAYATVADPGADPATFDLDAFTEAYLSANYIEAEEVTYKEIERSLQPDASQRVTFLLDAANATTQHNHFFQQNGPYFVVVRVRLPEEQNMTRTLSSITNTLSINEGAGWASIFQGDEAALADAVVFTNLNAYVGRNNTFEIVGQVRNNAPAGLEFIRITARLYDGQGQLLSEQDEFVPSDLIPAGEYAPFAIVFADGLPPATVRYDLEASARYADFAAQSFYGPGNFAVTSEATFDDTGLLVIEGEVRNEGGAPAGLVKVIVTVFDADGRVIGMDTTLVDQQRLAPGEISPYEVSFVQLGGSPNTFLVTAQGIIEE